MKEKKFCRDCGSKLERYESESFFFNEETGKKDMEVNLLCSSDNCTSHKHSFTGGGFCGDGGHCTRCGKKSSYFNSD